MDRLIFIRRLGFKFNSNMSKEFHHYLGLLDADKHATIMVDQTKGRGVLYAFEEDESIKRRSWLASLVKTRRMDSNLEGSIETIYKNFYEERPSNLRITSKKLSSVLNDLPLEIKENYSFLKSKQPFLCAIFEFAF